MARIRLRASVRQGQVAQFDANKDGALSLEEYQALWLDRMRERMVDAFQEHDDDGNGQVTPEEFNERFSALVERLDRNGDGQVVERGWVQRSEVERVLAADGSGRRQAEQLWRLAMTEAWLRATWPRPADAALVDDPATVRPARSVAPGP